MEKEAHLQAHMEQLYLEMSPHLVRYAYASVHNAETAKDLVQDVFKVACVKYEELAASANPRGWLMNTLKYILWNYHREKDRSINALCKLMAEQSEKKSLEAQMEAIQEAFFDSNDFLLLKRLYLDRETEKEIALREGIPLDTCKKRVRRAKERLKRLTEK